MLLLPCTRSYLKDLWINKFMIYLPVEIYNIIIQYADNYTWGQTQLSSKVLHVCKSEDIEKRKQKQLDKRKRFLPSWNTMASFAAIGAQDRFLMGDTGITFFKIEYRRHTNFALPANKIKNYPKQNKIKIKKKGIKKRY